MAGVGPLEIPLEEDYRAKDWTIQLRWPVSMNDVECFSDKIVEQDCGGKGWIQNTAIDIEQEIRSLFFYAIR